MLLRKSAYNRLNSDKACASAAMGKGGAMKKVIMVVGLIVLLCAQSGIALARGSRGHGQGHGRAPRSCGSYSHRGHSSLEAAFAVLAFAQMLRNGGDAAYAPPYSQPIPAYYPAYYPVENCGPDGWEAENTAPGEQFEMQ